MIRHLQGRLITESRQVIGFSITLQYTDVGRHTGGLNIWFEHLSSRGRHIRIFIMCNEVTNS